MANPNELIVNLAAGDSDSDDEEQAAGAAPPAGAAPRRDRLERIALFDFLRLVAENREPAPGYRTVGDLVAHLKTNGTLTSDAVSRAMLACPRDLFVPPPHRNEALADRPIRVEAAGFNISAPHVQAAALQALALEPGQRVLDVGCGCGIVTAYAAYLTGSTGEVVGVDIRDSAMALSAANLQRLRAHNDEFSELSSPIRLERHNVFVPLRRHVGRYDAVHVGGAMPEGRLGAILDLLGPKGGRIVAPLAHELRLVTKYPDGVVRQRVLSQVSFSELELPRDVDVVRALLQEQAEEARRVEVPPTTFASDLAHLAAPGANLAALALEADNTVAAAAAAAAAAATAAAAGTAAGATDHPRRGFNGVREAREPGAPRGAHAVANLTPAGAAAAAAAAAAADDDGAAVDGAEAAGAGGPAGGLAAVVGGWGWQWERRPPAPVPQQRRGRGSSSSSGSGGGAGGGSGGGAAAGPEEGEGDVRMEEARSKEEAEEVEVEAIAAAPAGPLEAEQAEAQAAPAEAGAAGQAPAGGGGSDGGGGLSYLAGIGEVLSLGPTDCELEGDGWRLPAHKAVLQARCELLRAHMCSGMRDSDATHYSVPEAVERREAVEAFLYYVYKDRLPDDVATEVVPQLLHAGIYFGCNRLVRLCEALLARVLLEVAPPPAASASASPASASSASNSTYASAAAASGSASAPKSGGRGAAPAAAAPGGGGGGGGGGSEPAEEALAAAVASACPLLALADEGGLDQLRRVALNFVLDHYPAVSASEGYRQLPRPLVDCVAAEAVGRYEALLQQLDRLGEQTNHGTGDD